MAKNNDNTEKTKEVRYITTLSPSLRFRIGKVNHRFTQGTFATSDNEVIEFLDKLAATCNTVNRV